MTSYTATPQTQSSQANVNFIAPASAAHRPPAAQPQVAIYQTMESGMKKVI